MLSQSTLFPRSWCLGTPIGECPTEQGWDQGVGPKKSIFCETLLGLPSEEDAMDLFSSVTSTITVLTGSYCRLYQQARLTRAVNELINDYFLSKACAELKIGLNPDFLTVGGLDDHYQGVHLEDSNFRVIFHSIILDQSDFAQRCRWVLRKTRLAVKSGLPGFSYHRKPNFWQEEVQLRIHKD